MAIDEKLAGRIREVMGARRDVTEKRMFGGLAFLLNGNMCCGVHGDELIVRVAPERTEHALAEAHTRRFDLTGRPMKGWILVSSAGIREDPGLSRWVNEAVEFARSLPAKR